VSEIWIRPARREDAADLVRLGNALARFLNAPQVYSVEIFERYGFGPDPHFEVLVAEWAGEIAGYALFEAAFNTDLCEPGMWLHDIIVAETMRRRGIGERLMAAVARLTLDRGCTSLWWGVLSSNTGALRFYAHLGARDEDARIQELDSAALRALADHAES
jgi:GNAT superfamily N-acetyltransferase